MFFTTKKRVTRYEVMDMLNSLIVVIVSQEIHIPNHHIVHLKYIYFISQLYSVKLEKNKLKDLHV